ncbi:protein-arginine deiminase family protein [Streptomyces sp. NPDC048295]|uniref:protein-arginine deiminase family protein n=1 Tax=Streptomyces sp. NPDC048295 TaxID=3154617 RepID=UPI003439EBC3
MDDETLLALPATGSGSGTVGRPRHRLCRFVPMSAGALGTALPTVVTVTFPAQPAHAATPGPVIRADSNRDGLIAPDDDAGKNTWTRRRGALMLPNVDDDQRRCPTAGPGHTRLPDNRLADCNNATDTVVNGPADLADLAPVHIIAAPHVMAGTTATVAADPDSRRHVRIFAERRARMVPLRPDERLTTDELRHGVRLGVEAEGFVRGPQKGAGFTDIVLKAERGGATTEDRLRPRVAPLAFQHDLMPIQNMMTADHSTSPVEVERGKDYDIAVQPRPVRPGEAAFRRDLRSGLDRSGPPAPLYNYPTGGDVWMQDLFKAAYASLPAPGGREHRVTVILRSADVMPGTATPAFPLRAGGALRVGGQLHPVEQPHRRKPARHPHPSLSPRRSDQASNTPGPMRFAPDGTDRRARVGHAGLAADAQPGQPQNSRRAALTTAGSWVCG